MELHIKSEFECVYLINGELFERADCLTFSEFDVIYVTVLPLKTTLLPYTVKLSCAENLTNELFHGVRLDEKHYLLLLSPRHMTVYASAPSVLPPPSSPISRLFSLIKNGDLGGAYAMLSESLRTTIEKSDLSDFFAGYERLTECDWESKTDDGTRFYLIDKNGSAKLHSYTLQDEFIDNIIEL